MIAGSRTSIRADLSVEKKIRRVQGGNVRHVDLHVRVATRASDNLRVGAGVSIDIDIVTVDDPGNAVRVQRPPHQRPVRLNHW